MNTVGEERATRLVTTEQAAQRLGLKRQEFLILKRFLGIQPKGKKRLNGKTPTNLYGLEDVTVLADFGRRCRAKGWRNVL